MIYSMTAFASVESNNDFGRLVWELRTVNHRYQETFLRLPEEFRPLEPFFREKISAVVNRGKLDGNLKFQPNSGFAGSNLELNEELAKSLLSMHGDLAALTGNPSEANPMQLLRWPGVVEEKAGDVQPLRDAAAELLQQALADLSAMRGREGAKLNDVITDRLDGIEKIISDVTAWLPEIRSQIKTKMLERVGQLNQPLDEGRMEQEVAFLAQKLDVDEELDRLTMHLSETRRVLTLDEPVGRRLDFLMQEFNREANTLSSKSADNRTSKAAVDLKVMIEQMREQVQNVE
jgi:uncharacterized protein (TIGR00255 family)